MEDLKRQYCDRNFICDKTKAQCGNCHLREGHQKRRCPYGPCAGPENCNDLDRHPAEKKQVSDAMAITKNLEKEIENLKQEIASKTKALDEIQGTFSFKIRSELINTNLSKYTFQSSCGRVLRHAIINNDSFILEKHFRSNAGFALKNLRSFQKIIDDFNQSNVAKEKKKYDNPIQKILTEKHNVRFPNFSQSSPQPGSLDIVKTECHDESEGLRVKPRTTAPISRQFNFRYLFVNDSNAF